MDVFIKEPLMDWMKLSTRLVREQEGGGSVVPGEGDSQQSQASSQGQSDARIWFPLEKIRIAKQKLSRYNPAIITRDELRVNQQISYYFAFQTYWRSNLY